MSEELFNIERELNKCLITTGKHSDSSRITGTPQRFLTKFLAVRLKDLLVHETVSKLGEIVMLIVIVMMMMMMMMMM